MEGAPDYTPASSSRTVTAASTTALRQQPETWRAGVGQLQVFPDLPHKGVRVQGRGACRLQEGRDNAFHQLPCEVRFGYTFVPHSHGCL